MVAIVGAVVVELHLDERADVKQLGSPCSEGHNTVQREEDNKPSKGKSWPNTEIVTGAVERGVENV